MTERVWSWDERAGRYRVWVRDGQNAGSPFSVHDEELAQFIVDALNEKEAREAEESQAIRDTFVVAKGEEGLFWYRNGQYERVPDEAVAQMQRRAQLRAGMRNAMSGDGIDERWQRDVDGNMVER